MVYFVSGAALVVLLALGVAALNIYFAPYKSEWVDHTEDGEL